ncbi:MAG: hypothetical protein FJX54_23525 [Alphaproteobacteria bacterium]|nr:hypothetical protein [Alphaproteobacteria bacterium]
MAEWVKTRVGLRGGRGFDRWFLDSGKPGYRVVIFGGVHGDETEGVIAANRLAGMALGLKAGSVTVLPIVNEEAYASDTRLTPADGGNLARAFPGKADGTPTEQIAYALTSDVLVGCDLLIDLHTSGRTLDIPFTIGYIDDGRDRKGLSERAAKVFGADFIWRHPIRPPGRTLNGADAAICTEAPGAEPTSLENAGNFADGVLRVLDELGMLEKPLVARSTRVSQRIVGGNNVEVDPLATKHEGLFIHRSKQGQKVTKGDLLGLVVNLKGETLEEIRADLDGWVVSLKYRPQVKKGEPVAGLAIADDR